jgi:serine protease inhibitor
MAVLVPQTHLEFGSRLLQQLLKRNEENVFFSPASLGLALGMAAAGASGQALAGIEHALGSDAKLAMNRAKRLLASLDSLPAGVTIEIANSLWATSGLPLTSQYTAAMAENYRGEVRTLDFTSPQATQVVNDWVARVTHGKIRSAVEQLDSSGILALVNAVYFNGLWEDPFDSGDSFDWDFTSGSGRPVGVRMMERGAWFDYMEDSDLQAVRVPYKERRFSLLVVLPRKPLLLPTFHDIASPNLLARNLAALRSRRGYLGLPKVRLDYAADLKAELDEMGMGPAFAVDADFSRLFDKNIPAFVSKVSHKTRLEIDEHGTTAAASTVLEVALGLSEASSPDAPFTMTVDRPFLLLLTENETDLILFLGVIGNPNP